MIVKPDFPTLLEGMIQERFGSRRLFVEKAQPEANQAGALSYLSQVITRKRPAPPEHLPAWADALGLRGAKRDDFFLVAAIGHIPEDLRERVVALYAQAQKLRE